MNKIKQITSPYTLSKIRVRSQPIIDTANVITNIENFKPIHVAKEKVGDWYHIYNDKNEGYVHSGIIEIETEPEEPEPEPILGGRIIIDLHPDTIIIRAELKDPLLVILRNVITRIENAVLYEETK